MNDPVFENRKWFQQIIEMLRVIIEKLDMTAKVKDALDGAQLLDNHDMCMLLGVTKRTLQRYKQFKKENGKFDNA